MNLGKKIINFRKKDKLTQEQLAELIGVTRQTISNWEQEITKPDINQIKEISKTFNISIDELLGNDIKNVFIEKANKTQNLVNKNTKNIRILVITIYIIILLGVILFTVYLLTKKDFTREYQTEFTCTSKDGEIYNISVDEEFNESENISEYYVRLSMFDKADYSYHTEEKFYAGRQLSEIYDVLELTKKLMIHEYHTICR